MYELTNQVLELSPIAKKSIKERPATIKLTRKQKKKK